MRTFVADIILIMHFAFVLFVVGGLALIWIGVVLRWAWARNFWFRAAHLGAIVFVAAEAVAGIWCPLTLWEATLRGTQADKGFIATWIHRLLFYDFPPWVFTAAYVTFALIVAFTFWLVPPAPRRKKGR
ncbi:MAG: hypothetical protein AMJ67_07720 [Betaproteobacteria bacterium SG8_41]|jgi:hypothetical protein|nr:MAG: hypothetical protein AMJ67_07720 [Betaproteobacteria bacterium SG8_41]